MLTLAVRRMSDVIAGESAEVVAQCSAAIDVSSDAVRLDVAFAATDHACVLDTVPVTDPGALPVTDAPILDLLPLPDSVDPRAGLGHRTVVPPMAGPSVLPGVPFELALGHCGLSSPLHADGAVWDPVGGVDATLGPIEGELELGELINATTVEAVLVHPDRLDLRTPLGTVIVLSRHVGAGEYPGCD